MARTVVAILFLFLSLSSSFAEVNDAVGQGQRAMLAANQSQAVAAAQSLPSLIQSGQSASLAEGLLSNLSPQRTKQNHPSRRQTVNFLSHVLRALGESDATSVLGRTAVDVGATAESEAKAVFEAAEGANTLATSSTTDTSISGWTSTDFDTKTTTLNDLPDGSIQSASDSLDTLKANFEVAVSQLNEAKLGNDESAITKATEARDKAKIANRDSTKIAKYYLKKANDEVKSAFDLAVKAITKANEVIKSGETKYGVTTTEAETVKEKATEFAKAAATVYSATVEGPDPDLATDAQPCKRTEYFDDSRNECVDLKDSDKYAPDPDQVNPADTRDMVSIASWVLSGLAGLLMTVMMTKLMYKVLLQSYKGEDTERGFFNQLQETSEKLTREKVLMTENSKLTVLKRDFLAVDPGTDRTRRYSYDICMRHLEDKLSKVGGEYDELKDELDNGAHLCDMYKSHMKPENNHFRKFFSALFIAGLLIQLFSYLSIRYQSDPEFDRNPKDATPKADDLAAEVKANSAETGDRKTVVEAEMTQRKADESDADKKDGDKKSRRENEAHVSSQNVYLYLAQLIMFGLAYGGTHLLLRKLKKTDRHVTNKSYIQRKFMNNFEGGQEIALDIISILALLLVLVRGFSANMGTVDLGLTFAVMTLIQIQVGYAVDDAGVMNEELKYGINGKYYFPYLPAVAMMMHAVFFPFMLVFRVREQRKDLAITPHQLQNLHFVSDFFGCIFVGVAVASALMNQIAPNFSKDMLYRFQNGAVQQMIKLRHFQYLSEQGEGWTKSDGHLEGYSTRFLRALLQIDKPYYCAALVNAQEQIEYKTEMDDVLLYYVLGKIRKCKHLKRPDGAVPKTLTAGLSQAALAELDAVVPEEEPDGMSLSVGQKLKGVFGLDEASQERNRIADASKAVVSAQHNLNVLRDANRVPPATPQEITDAEAKLTEAHAELREAADPKRKRKADFVNDPNTNKRVKITAKVLDLKEVRGRGVRRIIEIMTHPELLSGDKNGNGETLWGLIAAGYYGAIYNIIDMANGMTGDREIVANNIFSLLFSFFLFVIGRIVLGSQSSLFAPKLTDAAPIYDVSLQMLGSTPRSRLVQNLKGRDQYYCIPVWNAAVDNLDLPHEDCALFCRPGSCLGFAYKPTVVAMPIHRVGSLAPLARDHHHHTVDDSESVAEEHPHIPTHQLTLPVRGGRSGAVTPMTFRPPSRVVGGVGGGGPTRSSEAP